MRGKMSEPLVEQALFPYLRAALDFAYRIEWTSVHPTSQIGKLHIMWKPEYTIAERHAQAAMIQTHVSKKLKPAEAAFIECKYRYGPRRFSRIGVVLRHVQPAVASSNRRLIRELTYRYFRQGMTYERIAKLVGVDLRAIDRCNKKLVPLLSALEAIAEGQLEADFKMGGLIE